jgi:hypothetical protein
MQASLPHCKGSRVGEPMYAPSGHDPGALSQPDARVRSCAIEDCQVPGVVLMENAGRGGGRRPLGAHRGRAASPAHLDGAASGRLSYPPCACPRPASELPARGARRRGLRHREQRRRRVRRREAPPWRAAPRSSVMFAGGQRREGHRGGAHQPRRVRRSRRDLCESSCPPARRSTPLDARGDPGRRLRRRRALRHGPRRGRSRATSREVIGAINDAQGGAHRRARRARRASTRTAATPLGVGGARRSHRHVRAPQGRPAHARRRAARGARARGRPRRRRRAHPRAGRPHGARCSIRSRSGRTSSRARRTSTSTRLATCSWSRARPASSAPPSSTARAAMRAGAGLVTLCTWPEAARSIEAQVVEMMTARIDPDAIGSSRSTRRSRGATWSPWVRASGSTRRRGGRSSTSCSGGTASRWWTPTRSPRSWAAPKDLASAKGSVVLTPHPGELGRLLGRSAPTSSKTGSARCERPSSSPARRRAEGRADDHRAA